MMRKSETGSTTRLQALLLADHIYRDEGSGKYVIAGTFYQITLPSFPTTFSRSIGLFVSLYDFVGEAKFSLQFVDIQNNRILMQMTPFELTWLEPQQHMEFAVEIPPLPLPEAGRYAFQLLINDELVGESVLIVRALEEIGTSS
jgi:hypothetical protein